jgi:acylphosphatase
VVTVTRTAVRYLVVGRVQGVGFRWFTREQAGRLAVFGWVANADDGTVYGEAAGTAGAIEAFLGALQQGPPGSAVDRVSSTMIEADAVSSTGFEIRR